MRVASSTSTVSVWPASVAVQLRVCRSNTRTTGELEARARWEGASGGPIRRRSVTSSMFPISCLASASRPSFFLPCTRWPHSQKTETELNRQPAGECVS